MPSKTDTKMSSLHNFAFTSHQEYLFTKRCLSDILNGLAQGLSLFSGPSRAAVIFALAEDRPLLICDPHHLLADHELALKSLFVDNDAWRQAPHALSDKRQYAAIDTVEDLGLAGLISCAGYSGSVFYQRWFTEHQPDVCSIGPARCWLEQAIWRFSHDIANEKDLYTGVSGYFLRDYAYHAVRDYIVDLVNTHIGMDSRLRIYPVLEAILMISETREEGRWSRGKVLFTDPELVSQVTMLATFHPYERPVLTRKKHVRKLLQSVENLDQALVCDGRSILGICDGSRPAFGLVADFQGRHGFLSVNDEVVCSFADGRFSSFTYQTRLVHLEELLLEYSVSHSARFLAFQVITYLVHNAQRTKHGCTLVLDLYPEPLSISGQSLTPPLDLRDETILELATSLTRVDGALHIGIDGFLHGFSCLLDGRAFTGEDLARGARYNSALRFTVEHRDAIIVVVSSDSMVSVIHQGVELRGSCAVVSEQCVFPLQRLQDRVGARGK